MPTRTVSLVVWLVLAALLLVPPAPGAAQSGVTCPGFDLPSRLVVGEMGRTVSGVNSGLRAEPSQAGEWQGSLGFGGGFEVLEGPVCAEGLAWWRVSDYGQADGWIEEGMRGEYWLEPSVPTMEWACYSTLAVGEEGVYTGGLSTALYQSQAMDPAQIVGRLEPGAHFIALSEPVCPSSSSVLLQVDQAGTVGWLQLALFSECRGCSGPMYLASHLLEPLAVTAAPARPDLLGLPLSVPDSDAAAITLDNLDRLHVIQTLGDGRLVDYGWSPDGQRLYVATPVAVRIFAADQLDVPLQVLDGLDSAIQSVVYSPDGRLLVVGLVDGSQRLLDPATLAVVSVLGGPQERIRYGGFSADGAYYVTVGHDRPDRPPMTVVWDLSDAAHPARSQVFAGVAPDQVLFVPGSATMLGVVGQFDHTIVRFDLADGGQRELCPTDDVLSWTLAQDGEHVFILWTRTEGTGEGFAYGYGFRGCSIAGDEEPTFASLVRLPLSRPVMGYLGVIYPPGTTDDFFYVFDGTLEYISPEPKSNYRQTDVSFADAAFSPDGAYLALALPDGTIRLQSGPREDDLLAVLDGVQGEVDGLRFSPDSRRLAALGPDNAVHVWDLATRQRVGAAGLAAIQNTLIGKLTIDADASRLAIGDQVWDVASGARLDAGSWYLSGILSAPREDTALYLERTRVTLSRVSTGDILRDIAFFDPEELRVVAATPDGTFVAVKQYGGVEEVWAEVYDVASGALVGAIRRYGYDISALALSPNGRVLVIVGDRAPGQDEDTALMVFDVERGDLLYAAPYTSVFTAPIISGDGTRVAWLGFTSDGQTRVQSLHSLDLTTMNELTIEDVDLAGLSALNRDGSLLAVTVWDSFAGAATSQAAAYLIDTATGERVATLAESVARVDALAFSQDGTSLFVSWGGAVYVWAVQ